MIISQPEIQTRNNEVWVSAHVAFEKPDDMPSRLWFSFPEKYAPYISFEVIPVVPLGQVAEIMQKLAAARR